MMGPPTKIRQCALCVRCGAKLTDKGALAIRYTKMMSIFEKPRADR